MDDDRHPARRGPDQLSARIDTRNLHRGNYTIVMRVPNPLRNGIPLRFANTSQNIGTGWLTLGTVTTR